MKIHAKHIEKIVLMICDCHEPVPQLLELLTSIIKVGGQDTILKRNQSVVMKSIMPYFHKIGPAFDKPREYR